MSKRHESSKPTNRFRSEASSDSLHFASDDYPELEEILVERPPLEHVSTTDRYSMPKRVSLVASRKTASFNRENVSWQSPNGTWNLGFFEVVWEGDEDPEWEVEYDFDHFEWVSTGHDTQNEADDAWDGSNPGGGRSVNDPNNPLVAKYDAMAQELKSKGRRDPYNWMAYIAGNLLSDNGTTGEEDEDGLDEQLDFGTDNFTTTGANNPNEKSVEPFGYDDANFDDMAASDETGYSTESNDSVWEPDNGTLGYLHRADLTWDEYEMRDGGTDTSGEIDEPTDDFHLPGDHAIDFVESARRKASSYSRRDMDIDAQLEREAIHIASGAAVPNPVIPTRKTAEILDGVDYGEPTECWNCGYDHDNYHVTHYLDGWVIGYPICPKCEATGDEVRMGSESNFRRANRRTAQTLSGISREQAEQILTEINNRYNWRTEENDRWSYDGWMYPEPILIEYKDYAPNPYWVISWEDGPDNWAYGCQVSDPKVFSEPVYSFALGLFEAKRKKASTNSRPQNRKTAMGITPCQSCGGELPFGQPYGICVECTNSDRAAVPSKAFPEHLQTVNGSRRTATIYVCDACDGEGCPACANDGWVTSSRKTAKYGPCKQCGFEDNLRNGYCAECYLERKHAHQNAAKGSRKTAEVSPGMYPCPACDGKWNNPCRVCNGEGELTDDAIRAKYEYSNFDVEEYISSWDDSDESVTVYSKRKTARKCDYCKQDGAKAVGGYADLHLCGECRAEMQNEYDMERNYHEMYGSRKTAFVQTCPICDEGFESHESVYAANPQDDDVTAVCSDHCADIFEGTPPQRAVAQRKIAYPDDEYDECSRCGEEFWMGAYQCPYCGLGQDLPDGTRDHRTAAGMACQWGCGRDPVKAPRDEYGIPPYYDLCEEHREEYNAGGERPGFPNPRNSPMNVNRYSSLHDEGDPAVYSVWYDPYKALGEKGETAGNLFVCYECADDWNYGSAPTPAEPWEYAGHGGFKGWDEYTPGQSEVTSCERCGNDFSSLPTFDQIGRTASAQSTLHDEPEAALPSTDGNAVVDDEMDPQHYDEIGDDEALASQTASRSWLMDGSSGGSQSNADIAQAAQQHLKTALKEFSKAEQEELINEGEDVQASNLDRLQIEGTHYEYLEQQLSQADESGESVYWW